MSEQNINGTQGSGMSFLQMCTQCTELNQRLNASQSIRNPLSKEDRFQLEAERTNLIHTMLEHVYANNSLTKEERARDIDIIQGLAEAL